MVFAVAALAGCSSSPSPETTDGDFAVIPGLGSTRIDVPRPSGPNPATCEPLAASPTIGQTTEQRAAGLRNAGFFGGRNETDEEIARSIDEQAVSEYGETPSPTDPMSELLIAALDHSRVWWGDLEADVHPSNAVYEGVIEEWSAISGGAFAPGGIEETWASDQGPVSVSMTIGNRPLELKPAYLEDWIDPRILTPINKAIAASGRQFELYRAFDQTLFLVALRLEEKRALERDRGWCFEWPSPA